MKDYYRIGEISKLYGIGRDSLRYYEKIGILKPRRGKNNYRLYSLQEVWKLNLIKDLRNLDFPMQAIKEYINHRTIASTEEILNTGINHIEQKIHELNELRKNISVRLNTIGNIVRETKLNTIELKKIQARPALELHGTISRDEDVDFLVKKLQKKYEDKFYLLGNSRLGAVMPIDNVYKEHFNHYEAVFFLQDNGEPDSDMILEEGYYVTLSYQGAYEQSKIYIPQMLAYIKENHYTIKDKVLEIYRIDIHETSRIEEFITEIQIPVEV